MKQIVAFDFDGTLTTKDTLLEFIRYVCGDMAFTIGFLRYSPLLVLMKLGLYPNYKAKQKVFSYFFKGMSIEAFDAVCQRFAQDSRHLLRPQSVETLHQALSEGAEVLIVSASIDNWVKPFFKNHGDRLLDCGLRPNHEPVPVINSQRVCRLRDRLHFCFRLTSEEK